MLIDFVIAACAGFYFKRVSVAGLVLGVAWLVSGKSLVRWPLFSSGLFKLAFYMLLAAGLT